MDVSPGGPTSNTATNKNVLYLDFNEAVSLPSVNFEEVVPERGGDEATLRHNPFELLWLAVANSKDVDAPLNAEVKLHLSPFGGAQLPLFISPLPTGCCATVSPELTTVQEEPILLYQEAPLSGGQGF
jgi:hypothetical protein